MNNTEKTIINSIGLGKTFKDFWGRPKARAVDDVDFDVYEGEVLGFLGPNGSGKSTTVKMLLGLLYPTEGSLKVFGQDPRDVETKKRIGYLPEETYLYKYLTAEETLHFFGSLFNLSTEERKHRTEQLLDMVGLANSKDRQVGEFSKGMQRRIGLAQAMINDPDLLILDEPTSGLDPLGCREVKDLIKLLKSRGKTVFITSHLLSDVEDICDRVIILYGGKTRASGTLRELLTISNSHQITTPELKPEVMEKILKMLRSSIKNEKIEIDKPHMSLEEFFLDVVNKARSESAETSGVNESGKLADYLMDGAESERKAQQRKVVESLVSDENEKEKAEESEKIQEKKIRQEEEEKDREISETIDSLLDDDKKENIEKKAAVSDSEQEKKKDKELSEANRKLEDLL